MSGTRLLCPSCGAEAAQGSAYCAWCGVNLALAQGVDGYLGATVGKKYRIEKLIGEGGMGRVYLATQLALEKPVVLKILRRWLLSDERTVERFRREARTASRLSHPNSITVLDFGQTEVGDHYLAMEFVSGKDLQQILSTEWPLSEERVIRIVSQILAALAEAHAAGVIHRDLKPENIMIEQRRGDPDFVKVLDFGIAKIQDPAQGENAALTRAGFVCGTPEYMSPEQARGAELDARSDLYSVGVILYQLVAGALPFEATSPAMFATKHLTELPIPPSRRRPDGNISADMEALILRTLSKQPELRPQTALAFKAELLAVSKKKRTQPTELAPAARRSFRETRLAKAITLALFAGSIGLLGYVLYESRERLQAVVAPENPGRLPDSTKK
jgi:serine/threonine protein kinase